MKQYAQKLVLCAAAAASLLCSSSCNKGDDDPSRSELIVGTWTMNAYGVDDNMNGTLETSEYDPIPAGVNLVETFRADKTGSITTSTPLGSSSYNMKWRFESNDQNLIVTNDANGTSTTAVVSRLTSNELQGYDPAPPVRTIYLLKK